MIFNVVFIISDQHKTKVTGCYGNSLVKTPNIDKLAKNGVRFTKAYCDSPLCAPSRASILTGMRPHTHGALYHVLKRNPSQPDGSFGIPEVETLAGVFRKNGYVTGGIGKLHVHGETRQTRDLGFDERALRFYTYHFEDYIAVVGKEKKDVYVRGIGKNTLLAYNHENQPVELEETDMFDTLVVNRSLEFLEQHRDDKFFLWVGLEKPHTPWTAPKRFHDMYDPKEMVLPETLREQEMRGPLDYLEDHFQVRPTRGISDDTIRSSIAAYYANVTNMDENVGKVLAKVEELGLTDRTIFIYTSDHGEMLYEHGALEKHCFYEASVNVPLIIACPALLPEGIACDYLSSLIDLYPTLLEMVGIEAPAGIEGESLLKGIEGNGNPDKVVFSEFHESFPERMIRTKDWKYVYNHKRTEQLYDVKKDPMEVNNLAGMEEYREVVDDLKRKVLEGWNIALEQKISYDESAASFQ